MPRSPARWAATAALLLLCTASAAAQRRGREPEPQEPREPEYVPRGSTTCLEFAVSGDALWVAYRDAFYRGEGYKTLGFLANSDDDYVLSGRWMRFGEPSVDTPLGIGVGFGLLAGTIDDPDSEVFAVTLTGSIDYELGIGYPVRFGVDATWAPDLSTFSDGEEVVDLLGRVELDLSTWATAFVGYRHFEMDLDAGGEHDFDKAVQGGVRLGF